MHHDKGPGFGRRIRALRPHKPPRHPRRRGNDRLQWSRAPRLDLWSSRPSDHPGRDGRPGDDVISATRSLCGRKISRNPRRLHLLVPPPHRLRAADAGAGARRGDRHAPPRRHSRPRGLRRAHLGGGRPLQQRRLVASPKVRPRRSARVPRAGGRRGRVRDRRGARRGSPAPLHRHRRPAKLRSVRDRHRSERHVHVAGGVWVLRLSTRRSHPHRSRRVRQQRHRVPPGRGANRRRRRVRPVRRARAARRVGAGEDDCGPRPGACRDWCRWPHVPTSGDWSTRRRRSAR